MAKAPRLFLIDGSALAYRSYFAFIRNPLINSRGENTSAVFGFTRTLLDLLSQEQPQYIAVAFDTAAPTFRHERFPAYKATRQKMPEEMSLQLGRLREVADALGISFLELPGFEADDVMGTLTKKAEREGIETYLVTGDKDFMQLVSPLVKIYSLRKVDNQQEILDALGVQQKFGVPPERVIDVLALMGDSSDNVPGVPGIGEKTALKLIQDYGDLETVLARVAEIKPKGVAEKIMANTDLARLSRELVTIHTDVPLPCRPTDLAPRPRDPARLTTLFRELEFHSLVRQVAVETPQRQRAYRLVRSHPEFDALCQTLQGLERFAIDTETTDLNPLQAELVCISVAWQPGEAYCIPMEFPEEGEPGDQAYVLECLKPILENPAIGKCGQNIKYDMLVLSQHGIELQGVEFDTMVASYVLNPSGRKHNLDALALEYLQVKKIPITDLIGSGKGQRNMRDVPLEDVARYACEDADMTWRLRDLLAPKLKEAETWELFQKAEVPLIAVLKEMEQAGVYLDIALLQQMSREMDRQLLSLTQEIHTLAGEVFNINSTQQLGRILFEKLEIHKALGIKRVRKTKTGYSTDVAALEQFRAHALVGKILEYRQLAKLKSTYIDALPQLVNPKTRRVHTSYNQTVTATGRLSCLPAGTLVNTQQGLVGIETVRRGDFIRTPYGPRRVLDWQPTGEKPVVVLRLSNGTTLRCSPQHRLRSLGNWIEAQHLNVGDPVYMSFREGLFGNQVEMDLHVTSAFPTRKSPQLPREWTVELAELVGYHLADGHIARSNYNGKPARVVLAFDWDETDLMDYFAHEIQGIFGKTPIRRLTKSCPVLQVSGVDIGGALIQLGAGELSGHIRVPPSLFKAPEPIIAAFLRGYFEGDGCSAYMTVRSVSRRMLEGVQQLLTLFGIPATILEGTADPRGYARRYTLHIVGDRSKKTFRDRINFLSAKKRSRCDRVASVQSVKSTAENLTLPAAFKIDRLKAFLYDAHRNMGSNSLDALYVFTSKLARGRRTITLPRAEWVLEALSDIEALETSEGSFIREIVEAGYYEVSIAGISYEPPAAMYDICVEDVEQYMAQGIVVHNSSQPNLQNIPARTELGREIRKAFIAEGEDRCILSADYSQIELRILAHLSQDATLIQSFRAGEDVHRRTASLIFGVPPEQVTAEQRARAKTINFGVIYGMGPTRLAREIDISLEEAREFIERYFATYPGVHHYTVETIRKAKEQEYVTTLLGRRRYLPELFSDNQGVRAAAENMAINTPVQGSSADIIKLAMINIRDRLRQERLTAQMILQVHDELVFEMPVAELEQVKSIVVEQMERAVQLDVPIKVDVGAGRNWFEAH